MKNLNKYLILSGAAALLSMGAVSCSDDAPFGVGDSGVLKMKMVINAELTRAAGEEENLAETAVIYISNNKGLIHKYEGLAQVPSEIVLKSGSYVAEAWAGDSVTASFDKRFFRAYEPFEIDKAVNNIVLNCKIANVVASINSASIDTDMMSDWKITVANSRGSLEFTEENVNTAHGYFMMPNGDTTLTWTISGTDQNGQEFSKSGEILNVERAHEYVLNVKYGEGLDPNSVGGAFITIEVDDRENLIEDTVELHFGPQINAANFNIDNAVLNPKGSFGDLYLTTQAFGHYGHFNVTFSDKDAFGVAYDFYDLANLATSEVADNLRAAGFDWTENFADNHTTGMVTLKKEMLNRLEDGEYTIDMELIADDGRKVHKTVKINVSDALVAPEAVHAEDVDYTSVVVPVSLKDENVQNAQVGYRLKGTQEWTYVPVSLTRAVVAYATITGLTPGKEYEYRVICDGFESPIIMSFTTKAPFALPNAGFEQWSTCSDLVDNVPFPGSGSKRTFWDTGNHGSMTLKVAITNSATDIKHSGKYSIKMESQKVSLFGVGKFAAGNVFAGEYVGTDGTDGILAFGRPFEGPKPAKLRGWIHYRPKAITERGNNAPSFVPAKGEMDEGEIYVALTKGAVEIRTKNAASLFKDHMDQCVAYGSLILNKDYGTDGGEMVQFEVPFTIQPGMAGEIPTHIVIVASASRWGDYFSGGPSVLYLDDLELIYE